jgi:GNAT superfamily N-acetyltransferase
VEQARPAAPADVEAIAELVREGVAALSVLRGGAVWELQAARREPIEDGVRADLVRDPSDGATVVGAVAGTIVGYGCSVVEALADGSRLSVVRDLYVHPEARGIGVGEAMMNLLVAHAEAVGAIGIDALALPGDRQTKNFFETFGLKARAIVVHRPLGPSAGKGREGGS